MTTKITWTPENKKKLLACKTDGDMARAFPDVTLTNLDRRRREFRQSSITRPKHSRPVAWGTTDLALQWITPKATNEEQVFIEEYEPAKTIIDTTVHVVIPDTQAAPGRPTDHLRWIGQYLVDQFADKDNVKIIHLGDHADMPSLSSYDKGKMAMENRRVMEDIEAANDAFQILNQPMIDYNNHHRRKWNPEKHITLGNHCDRITRAIESDAQMEGLLSLDMLNYADLGWSVHPFLKPVLIDGIIYSHYFSNPMTGRPYGGLASTRLKTLGFTFIQGHQQTLDYAIRFVAGKSHHGLVAGACYLADESYKGYQGNAHWRGIIVCHDVNEGSFDAMFVSLPYLCRRYEGVEIDDFMEKKYKMSYNGGW